MIAIETRYVGPTNVKGSRIIATTANGQRHTISYPHELNPDQAHRRCAEELRDKMGWKGRLIGGGTKRGFAFVFDDGDASRVNSNAA